MGYNGGCGTSKAVGAPQTQLYPFKTKKKTF